MPGGKPPSPGRAKELGLGRGKFGGQPAYDGTRGSPSGFPGAGTRDKLTPDGPPTYTTPPKSKPNPF